MISGDNGILKKVVQAKESTDKASVEEKVRLAIQSALSRDYNEYGRITKESLIQELEKNVLIENEDDLEEMEDEKWELNKSGEKYLIYSDGNLEIKKGKLPLGYKELEYIESTGTQYIDTDYKPNQNTQIKAYMKFTNLNNTDNVALFGTRTSYDSSDRYAIVQVGNESNIRTDFYNTVKYSITKTTTYLEVDKNKNVTTINGQSTTNTNGTFTCANNLLIFAMNDRGSAGWKSKSILNFFQIYDNDMLIRNFIPCKNSQGKIGLYDTVTETFFGNANSSGDDFTPGPEVN